MLYLKYFGFIPFTAISLFTILLTASALTQAGTEHPSTSLRAAGCSIETYPALPNDLYKSDRYRVQVTRSGCDNLESYVYQSNNDFVPESDWSKDRDAMSDSNHWTTFSSDDPVTVTVSKLDGTSISSATVHPKNLGIEASINGSSVTFTANQPAKLWVQLDNDFDNPLFVFPSEAEKDVPSSKDPSVIFFGPGVHDVEEVIELNTNQTAYLAGGAYVKGEIHVVGGDSSNVTIRGRGILSGIDEAAYTRWNTEKGHRIRATGSQSNITVDGITITDSPLTNIHIYAKDSLVRNVNIFGWHFRNDGIDVGSNSLITGNFIKTNDDEIKITENNLQVENNVLWHMVGGAPIQMGWHNMNQTVSGVQVINNDILHSELSEYSRLPEDVLIDLDYQRVVSIAGTGADGHRSDYLFKDIRVWGHNAGLVGFRVCRGGTPGTNQEFDCINGLSGGSVSNIRFENWFVEHLPPVASHLNGASGPIKNISFNNFKIAGKDILNQSDFNNPVVGGGLKISGDTHGVTVGGASVNNDFTLPHNQWRQVSLPAAPPSGASTVSAIFGDELDNSDYGNSWIMYYYDLENNEYVDPGLNGTLKQGVGYWIVQHKGADITLKLPDASTETSPVIQSTQCASANGCYEISLATVADNVQWNMVGNPFPKSINLDRIRVVTADGSCSDGCTLDLAEKASIVQNKFWRYNGTTYDPVGNNLPLLSWDGFWCATLKSAYSQNPKLLIPVD